MAFEYPSTKTAKREKKEKEEQAKIEKAEKTFDKKFDKKFAKYAGSREAHLHAKDFDQGVNRAEDRAFSETKHKLKLAKGGRVNTRRENRLEELGRVDAEKAYTRKGKRNLRAEKKRIVREVSSRGAAKRGHGKEIK